MERREIAGILLIAAIGSTMVTYHIQRSSQVPIELLEEEVPQAIPYAQKTTHELSASFVLRRDAKSVIWDFDFLFNATSKEGDPTKGVDEAIGLLVDLFEGIGAPFAKEDLVVDGGKGVLYDFSDTFSRLAPKLATLSATTVYSKVEIDGRRLAFRGVSDYLANRNSSLASVTLSRNEIPEIYLTMQAGEAQAQGKPSVMEAPILGRKEYEDNAQDDRISTRLVVNSIGVPAHYGVMEVMRIHVDAESYVARGYLIPGG